MKQLIPALALVAAAPLAFSPAPALAALPASFTATGTALMHANGNVPEARTPVKVYHLKGQTRLEMKTPGSGSDSVVLVQKGKPTMTLMDVQQKVAFTVNPAAMADSSSQLAVQQLTDITGWKALLQKQGKRLAGTEVRAGQTCSIWEARQGKTTTKVWFSDALELPMHFESWVDGKRQLTFSIQSISTSGTLAPTLFKVPADYTQADLQN